MVAFRRWPTVPEQALDASELAVDALKDLRIRFRDEGRAAPVVERAEAATRRAAVALTNVHLVMRGLPETVELLGGETPPVPSLRRAQWRIEHLVATFDELAVAVVVVRDALEELRSAAVADEALLHWLELLIRNARAAEFKAASFEWADFATRLRRAIDVTVEAMANEVVGGVLTAAPAKPSGSLQHLLERAHDAMQASSVAERAAREDDIRRGLASPLAASSAPANDAEQA